MKIINLEGEIWLPIQEYVGLYEVSNMGRIKSLRFGKEKLKSFSLNGNYLQVSLQTCSTDRKTWKVHRLVAIHFIPNPLNLETVNHKWGIFTDNRASELEWMSYSENILHAFRVLGREGSLKGITGKNHFNSKALIQYDLKMNFIKEWDSIADIKRELGYDKGHISACCLLKAKSAYGFIWRYKEKAQDL